MKKSIRQIVHDNKNTLILLSSAKELKDWAAANGMDSKRAFPKFKDALYEYTGINYNDLKRKREL